jgi:zinc protease
MKRKFFLVVLTICLGFGLASAQPIAINYERFTLSNGLDVVLHEDHSIPSVAVNVWYHVGSGSEKPGRTGFAHLFEHIMFEGSGNVPEGKFDEWLEAAGGNNNGSTTPDRTNYFEEAPSNALELMLFLEADRMGHLLDAMTPGKVDGQRDVVKNERRQSYENRPYGMSSLLIDENLYPANHPYHWPTIGSMEDLSAASYQDVVDFFKTYYIPNNASLVIAGDIDPVKTKELVIKWFDKIPAGNAVPPVISPVAAYLTEQKRVIMEDKVQLPRLYMNWHTPAIFTPGDAEMDVLANVLAGGKNSRLYKKLVYDLQIAQDVSAFQSSGMLGSSFQITATARSGHTLSELEQIIWQELNRVKNETPSAREVQRAINQYEASFLDRLEYIAGKADQLNGYLTRTGNPDYFNEDLGRYKSLAPDDIRSAAQSYLKENAMVVLSVVPEGKRDLALPMKEGGN